MFRKRNGTHRQIEVSIDSDTCIDIQSERGKRVNSRQNVYFNN